MPCLTSDCFSILNMCITFGHCCRVYFEKILQKLVLLGQTLASNATLACLLRCDVTIDGSKQSFVSSLWRRKSGAKKLDQLHGTLRKGGEVVSTVHGRSALVPLGTLKRLVESILRLIGLLNLDAMHRLLVTTWPARSGLPSHSSSRFEVGMQTISPASTHLLRLPSEDLVTAAPLVHYFNIHSGLRPCAPICLYCMSA